MTDPDGIPLSAFTTSAQDAEVNTIQTLVDHPVTGLRPQRLLYDKAADANWLRDALQDLHMELITPHRRTAPAPAVKTFEVYDDTDNDGTLNTRSAGCLTPHDFSSGTNAAHSCSKNSFTWHNLLLY